MSSQTNTLNLHKKEGIHRDLLTQVWGLISLMYRGSSKGEPTQEQTFAPSAFAAKSTVANPNAPAAAVTSTV